MSKRRFLFQLNHPAHFHLFKNVMNILKERGHKVVVTIKDKDILVKLVKNYEYIQISKGYRKKNLYSILSSVYERDLKLYRIVKKVKPDLMIGTSPEIGHISKFVKAPALFLGEDDVNLSTPMFLGAVTCYPFFHTILAPLGVNNSIWNKKTIFYQGFQKLAYLHPNRFKPDRLKVEIPEGRKFFILRFANLQAYHDTRAKGITNELAYRLIEFLRDIGEILISSERDLPESLEPFRFKGKLDDIHHYLYFADLYVGDSQSMAVEAAMLGTPNIRFNDFVGKISVLEEIENEYGLTLGIHSSEPEKLFTKVKEIVDDPELRLDFRRRRDRLIDEKIDVSSFFVWFIENYPQSINTMRKNPDYQNNFK